MQREAWLSGKIKDGGAVELVGMGSKKNLGQPGPRLPPLSLQDMTGIEFYEPAELILEAWAATPLDEIEALLAQNGQYLAFEPPDFGVLLGSGLRGSLGGALACNLSGPRRLKAGAARDHCLGFTGVNGRGEIFKAGGRVVKNVTGFDLPKLMAGSFGTLAALTRITMKVLPAAIREETLVLETTSLPEAVMAMAQALASAAEVSSAACLDGLVLLRLEGTALSIAARRDRLVKLLGSPSSLSLLGDKASRQCWRELRDVLPLAAGEMQIWRIHLPASETPATLDRLRGQFDLRFFLDWGGSLIWLAIPAQEDAGATRIRASFSQGQAMLVRANDEVRARVDVLQPPDAARAALEARVKASFDPDGKLNPGRMRRG